MSLDSLKIEVAGFCVEVNMGSLKPFVYLDPWFKGFITKNKADFVVQVNEKEQAINLDNISIIEKNGTKIFCAAKVTSCRKDKPLCLPRQLSCRQAEIGFIDLKNRVAEINLSRKDAAFIIPGFLRLILGSFLASNGGMLVHASGVVKDGLGYLFVGAPDSGKSTVAKASKGLSVLSDDCICLRKINGKFYSFGTPWSPCRNNDSGELTRIFFLRKAKTLKFRRLTAPKLMQGLFRHGRFNHLNVNLTNGILNTISEIAATIPSYDMYFSLKDNIWEGIAKWAI